MQGRTSCIAVTLASFAAFGQSCRKPIQQQEEGVQGPGTIPLCRHAEQLYRPAAEHIPDRLCQ